MLSYAGDINVVHTIKHPVRIRMPEIKLTRQSYKICAERKASRTPSVQG